MIPSLNDVVTTPAIIVTLSSFDQATSSSTGRLAIEVIFATGSPVPARAAKAATSTIPIVFAYGGDPVSDGLVASFNRPGGNVTGATFIGTALTSKRMELLREILPQVSDVALLVNPKGTLAEVQINEAKAAAQALGADSSYYQFHQRERVR